jgi:hypothetical protein
VGPASLIDPIFQGRVFVQAEFAPADRQLFNARLSIFERILEIETSFVRDLARALALPGSQNPIDQGCLRATIGPPHMGELEARMRSLHQRHSAFFAKFRESRFDFYFPLGEVLCEICSQFSEELTFGKFTMAYMVMPDQPVKSSRSIFVKSSGEGRRAAHACLLQLSTIGEAYRHEIVRAVRATPRFHPDYSWVCRCQRMIDNATAATAIPESTGDQRPALPGFAKLLRKETDVAVFTVKQERTLFRLAMLKSSLLVIDEAGRNTVSSINEPQSAELLVVGVRSIMLRVGAGDLQTFSLEPTSERDRFVAQFTSRFAPILPTEMKIDPIRVNMRMRFHSLAGISENGLTTLYSFGGIDDDFGTLGQLFRLDLTGDGPKWASCPGAQPPPRRRAAMTSTSIGLFLFGGKADGRVALDDFWLFDGEWRPVALSGGLGPPGGWGHDIVACSENELLLTGGSDSFLFHRCTLSECGAVASWTTMEPAVPFLGLIGHRTFLIGEGYGVIIGGKTQSKQLNTDVLLFENWGARVWPLTCTGVSPLHRTGATFAKLGNFIVCMGGPVKRPEPDCFVLDLVECRWYLVRGDWPDFHSAAGCTVEGVVYIHGGIDGDLSFRSSMFRVSVGEIDRRPSPALDSLRQFARDGPVLANLREKDWDMPLLARSSRVMTMVLPKATQNKTSQLGRRRSKNTALG